jgi:hypothetical protein
VKEVQSSIHISCLLSCLLLHDPYSRETLGLCGNGDLFTEVLLYILVLIKTTSIHPG